MGREVNTGQPSPHFTSLTSNFSQLLEWREDSSEVQPGCFLWGLRREKLRNDCWKLCHLFVARPAWPAWPLTTLDIATS